MSAQPIEWIRFGQFMALGLYTGYVSEGLGILIGSSVNNSVSSMIFFLKKSNIIINKQLKNDII